MQSFLHEPFESSQLVLQRRIEPDKTRTVTVAASVPEGLLANTAAGQINPRLKEMVASLPVGYRLEQGGEQEETAKAQIQVVQAVMIAIVLIILVLTTKYNSLTKNRWLRQPDQARARQAHRIGSADAIRGRRPVLW